MDFRQAGSNVVATAYGMIPLEDLTYIDSEFLSTLPGMVSTDDGIAIIGSADHR